MNEKKPSVTPCDPPVTPEGVLGTREHEIAELCSLAVEMSGYVKSYGLSDWGGASSEWDQWRRCRDRMHAVIETLTVQFPSPHQDSTKGTQGET